jgi:hypothetical protein
VKEVDRIRLENSAQLGSLEDTSPVKRLEASEIRRMRARTHEQTKFGFSLVRWLSTSWSNLSASYSLLFSKPDKDCRRNGHTAYTAYGGVTRCRYCAVEMQSLDNLLKVK